MTAPSMQRLFSVSHRLLQRRRPLSFPRYQSGSSSKEWIPPQRPLAGDVAQSHLFHHVEEEKELSQMKRELSEIEKEEEELAKKKLHDSTIVKGDQLPSTTVEVDWLQTRREMLERTNTSSSSSMTFSDINEQIPVKHHTLLSAKELQTILKAMGGTHIQLIADASRQRGCQGIIVVTAEHHRLRQTIAQMVLTQMKRRKLHEVGVVGAQLGIEGNLNDPTERWLCVDCHNYVIHIQDEKTRRAINLESLWSGKDGIYFIDLMDEEAVEDYVVANPVPEDYNVSTSVSDTTIKQIQSTRWLKPMRPTTNVKKPRKAKRRS